MKAAIAACLIGFSPCTLFAATGMCESADGNIAISILTNEQGNLLDLALTDNDTKISRFPEANSSSLILPSKRYTFKTKKTSQHDALELDVSGNEGKMKYKGKVVMLECNWS